MLLGNCGWHSSSTIEFDYLMCSSKGKLLPYQPFALGLILIAQLAPGCGVCSNWNPRAVWLLSTVCCLVVGREILELNVCLMYMATSSNLYWPWCNSGHSSRSTLYYILLIYPWSFHLILHTCIHCHCRGNTNPLPCLANSFSPTCLLFTRTC